ncbi:MAG: RimK family alpha-L-glutamate ligase [Planctomycetaceae bacterium]
MRIGVLGNDGSWYVEQLQHAGQERSHTVIPLRFPEICVRILGGRTRLTIGETDISTLDALIVRTMPPGSLEQVVLRMDFLSAAEQLGVRIVNSPRAIECAVDKYLTTQKLAVAGLPVPDTIVCEDSDAAMQAFETLGRDVVVKPVFGAEGRGILRVDHPEMALRTFRTLERLNTTLYVQRFLKGPLEDIRILLLDGKPVASMKRRPADGDFRANAAQNGITTPWAPTDEELHLAIRAADVSGCVFSGIDLMYNEHAEPMIIEVNAVPGWRRIQQTCCVDVPQTLLHWLEATSQHAR